MGDVHVWVQHSEELAFVYLFVYLFVWAGLFFILFIYVFIFCLSFSYLAYREMLVSGVELSDS